MIKYLPFFLVLVLPFICFSQDVDFDEIDNYLQKTATEWEIPSMAVGIVKDGELVFAKGYGHLEEGKSKKADENTLYAIASNSKAFTSAIVAMLVQEGKLDWNEKVVDYLPYFEVYDKDISQMVTIKDLLTHRIGLGTFSGDAMWYDSDLSTEEIVRRAKYIPQAYEFRDGYGYSNVMYITAGAVIEKVTGKSWGQNVQERILNPLGMNRTVYTRDAMKQKGNWAVPHATLDGKNKVIRYENWENVGSTGGIISSVNDLSKWLIFNMNNGIVGKDTLLTKTSRNMIWTGWNPFPVDHTTGNPNDADFAAYGLGFGLGEYNGKFRVSHTGGFGGMLSSIYMLPDEKLGVIMLSNDTESPIRAVPFYILDRFVNPTSTKDYSADMLKSTIDWKANDTRVQKIKDAQVKGTKPSKALKEYAGDYYSDLYGGNISVSYKKGKLQLSFEHQPHLSATLSHWHYDTFQIHWNEIQPWFGFGVVEFKMDARRKINGLGFDVPNNDFFFEEFKAYVKE